MPEPKQLSPEWWEEYDQASVVAEILNDHGVAVRSPDQGELNAAERQRWEACIQIVRRLKGA